MTQPPIVRTFLLVTAGALAGMLLGGGFGAAAGWLAPMLFQGLAPGILLQPVAAGMVLGAAVGILLGGALAAFALLLQVLREARPGGSR